MVKEDNKIPRMKDINKLAVGLENVDNTADNEKYVKGLIDYANHSRKIEVGYAGDGLTVNNVTHLAGYTENGNKIKDVPFSVVKEKIELDHVDNTSDADKPVSTAQQTALDAKVNKSGDKLTGELVMEQGSMVARETGEIGVYGYVKTIQIKILQKYVNYPIIFEIAGRNWQYSRKLYVCFEGATNTDPGLKNFFIDNQAEYKVAIIKSDTSTWDIYVQKAESYGSVTVCSMYNTVYNAGNVQITFPDTLVSALPAGAIEPTVIPWDKTKNADTVDGKHFSDIQELINNKQNIRNGNVGENVDWNTIVTPGAHKIQYTTMDADHHAPVGEYRFGILFVIDSEIGGESRILQMYFPHQPNISPLHIRMRNSGAWNDWVAVTSAIGMTGNAATLGGMNKDQFVHKANPVFDGNLNCRGNIWFNGEVASKLMIQFLESGNVDGHGISIGGGGMTIIGGGESAYTIAQYYTNDGTVKNGGAEKMIVGNDGIIEFLTNCQNGFSSAKHITMNTDGTISAEGFNGKSIISSLVSGTHLAGNQGKAIINSTAAGTGYNMLARMKSPNGVWTLGSYRGEFVLNYTGDDVISAGTNAITRAVALFREDGTSSFAFANHTHSKVSDSGNNQDLTFAYSKAGLASTSWLAGWNGTELRAISPDNVVAGSSKKLSSSAGATNKPVYFKDGKPTECAYEVNKSVPANANFGNTWRGIQDNLTSESTEESLSANQGRLLASGSARDDTKLPLSGGNMTGSIITPANDSMGIIPATDNYGQIGSSDKKYYKMYTNNMYANTVYQNNKKIIESGIWGNIGIKHNDNGTLRAISFNLVSDARYVRVGNDVHVKAIIKPSVGDSSITEFYISGLPFTNYSTDAADKYVNCGGIKLATGLETDVKTNTIPYFYWADTLYVLTKGSNLQSKYVIIDMIYQTNYM